MMRSRPKVICCGFHKTATSSLSAALTTLGFKVSEFDERLLVEYSNGDERKLWRVTRKADAFRDWPWPLVYRAFMERYPDARAILTVRDTDSWIASLKRHAAITGPTVAREIVYGHADVAGHEAAIIGRYETHNADVRSYFHGNDALLEFDAEHGDGWNELCTFLDLPTPTTPFPHRYRTA